MRGDPKNVVLLGASLNQELRYQWHDMDQPLLRAFIELHPLTAFIAPDLNQFTTMGNHLAELVSVGPATKRDFLRCILAEHFDADLRICSITKCEDGVRNGMLSDYELNVDANTEESIYQITRW